MIPKISKNNIRKFAESADPEELSQLIRENERTTCMMNLYYLATEVLGYKDLGAIHEPICEITQSVNPLLFYLRGDSPWKTISEVKVEIRNRLDAINIPDEKKDYFKTDTGLLERLFLMFRGGFKSTIINISHCIQCMIIYPDIRILICSHKKEDGSEPFLRAIKHHFMANEVFRDLFPEYCPERNQAGKIEWGTKDSVTLPNRSAHKAHPESTIETAGMTTNVTGRHYDMIKADDLVTRDSVTNETMIQNTRQQYALLQFLFDQPEWGIKDIIGTPYHFADLYNDLRRSAEVIKVAIPCWDDERKEPTFPERFSQEGIEQLRTSAGMTSYDFSCQYMLNPVPPEDQTFRPEWFERLGFWYEKAPQNLKIYIFVDPANARNRRSDYTAMIVIGVDSEGMMYLLDAMRDKLNVEQRTNKAYDYAKKHNCKKVHWESVGFQDTDRYILEKKSREFGNKLVVEPIKASHGSKEDRIRGLQPIYERGMIRWPREIRYFSDYHKKTFNMIDILKDEMLMFPKCEHDDMVDCHAQILQVWTSKAAKTKIKPKEDAFEWWRKQAINMRTKPKFKGFTHAKQHEVRIPSKESWK